MPRIYIYTNISLEIWKTYFRNPALFGRRPRLRHIIRRREIFGFRSRRGQYLPAKFLGLLQALYEAMPRRRHFRTAYRLTFFKKS